MYLIRQFPCSILTTLHLQAMHEKRAKLTMCVVKARGIVRNSGQNSFIFNLSWSYGDTYSGKETCYIFEVLRCNVRTVI